MMPDVSKFSVYQLFGLAEMLLQETNHGTLFFRQMATILGLMGTINSGSAKATILGFLTLSLPR